MRRIGIATLLALPALLAACEPAPEPGSAGGPEAAGGMAGMAHEMGAALDTAGLRALAVPAEHQRGAELYAASCAPCHGEAALGAPAGPPLVHIVYEPSHHGDGAFVMAAERGVRAHHWSFGDMPPRPELSREEVLQVTGYVRWLQREAGVY